MPNHWFPVRANSTSRGIRFAAASAMCWLALLHGVHAAGTCTGTYSASLVHSLQSPIVVMLPNNGRPEMTDFRSRFVTGLHRGGMVTSGQPTTRLDLTAM